VACGSVLLGTLYPLIIDALNLGKLSVGPPYFNAVFVPIMVPLLFLMAAGPIARWKHADLRDIGRRLRVAAVIAVAAGIGLPFLAGRWTPLVALGLLAAVWISAASIMQIAERLKVSGGAPPSFWGMHIAHLGIAVFVVGVTMVGGYQEERDVRMGPGDTVTVGGYTFTFAGVREAQGPNYTAFVGDVDLSKDGKVIRRMNPEKRNYLTSTMPMTEAAIDYGLTRDVYVSLGEPLEQDKEQGAWAVRVYYKPFVDWIWFGCLFMALGGLIAASDRRYRLKTRSTAGRAALEGATS
jgi:cytochrome c-type biogenesis protein CcmF